MGALSALLGNRIPSKKNGELRTLFFDRSEVAAKSQRSRSEFAATSTRTLNCEIAANRAAN